MFERHGGKIIAGLFFIGGAVIIRSLMRSDINMPYFITGSAVLLLAIILLIGALRRI